MIRYSDAALTDVQRLTASLAERDHRLALRFFELLDEAERKIASHPATWPRAGRARKVHLTLGAVKYLVHYIEIGDDQEIVRIWHGREDRP